MPLTLILADCGLELIPKKIRKHPAVKRNYSKRLYASQLLDNSIHSAAMQSLKNRSKRGRPDILHLCLLNALESVLNKTRNLEIYFHTYQNRIFNLNPQIRISKNYNRFKGLMAKLLIDGIIKSEDKILINELNQSIESIIQQINPDETYIMTEKGTIIEKYTDLFSSSISKKYLMIIGGFQKGSFSQDILNLSKKNISLSKYPLTAWVALYKTLVYYELINKIM